VELDQLCLTLGSGYLRATEYDLYAIFQPDCSPAVASDDDAIRFSFGNVDVARSLCSPDGGFLFRTVQDIQRGVMSGRTTYHADRAGNCVASGRLFIQQSGGLLATAGNAAGGHPIPTLDACRGAVEGHQAPGEPCTSDAECAQGTRGATCWARSGAECAGTCRELGVAGDACGGSQPGCASGMNCTNNQCVVRATPPGAGQACTGTCADGLWCRGGICIAEGDVGAVCVNTIGQSGCKPCLACIGPSSLFAADAGPASCRAFAGVGESCAGTLCHMGLFCIGGTCLAGAAHGASCTHAGVVDAEQRGNCFNRSDTCIGNPATCQDRAALNAPCVSEPGTLASQGSCDRTVAMRCSRVHPQDTTGTCVGEAEVGAPCGYVQNLTSECSGNASCSVYSDGGVGTCRVSGAKTPQGGACTSDYECARGLYCSTGVRVCTPGGEIGSPCSFSQPWGSTCRSGACKSGGADAGYQYVCLPWSPAGGPCTSVSDCMDDLTCDTTLGQCNPLPGEGAACSVDQDCRSSLRCSQGACTSPACAAASAPGSNCSNPSSIAFLLFFGAVVGQRKWLSARRAQK
jgi:hypothetical protein